MNAVDDMETGWGAEEVAAWRLAVALARSVTPHEVAEALADEAVAAVGAATATLATLEADAGLVRVIGRPALGPRAPGPAAVLDITSQVPVCAAIRDGQPVLVTSAQDLEGRYPDAASGQARGGLGARALLPLRSANGTTLGAVDFGWNEGRGFTTVQLRRADFVAQLAGLALERAGEISARLISEVEPATELGDARQANFRLRFLSELSTGLIGVRTEAQVFRRLTSAVVPALADWCTLLVPADEALVRIAAAHRDPVLDALAKRLVGTYPHSFDGPSPGVVAYRRRQPLRLARLAEQIVADLDDSAASATYGRTLQLLGDGPGLITPFIRHGEVAAVLTLVRGGGVPFGDAEIALLDEVAELVSLALDEADHVRTQREAATALQEASLPTALPTFANLELAAAYRAASEGAQVGGDWYDAFELPTGRMALVVGDAVGHGLQAAALMAQLRNTLRANLFAPFGPAESLSRLSRLLATEEPGAFATVICVEVDPLSGEVTWSSAGHPSPILVRGNATSQHLSGRVAPPIGWIHATESGMPVEHHLVLQPGDRLLMFTDGLFERRGADLDVGLTHLMILAEQTHKGMGAETAGKVIFEEMLADLHEDDVCLLIADFGIPRSPG